MEELGSVSTPSVSPSTGATHTDLAYGLRPARRRTLSEELTRQLLEQIAAGESTDARLPSERTLAELF
jgi:hypothetical protein